MPAIAAQHGASSKEIEEAGTTGGRVLAAKRWAFINLIQAIDVEAEGERSELYISMQHIPLSEMREQVCFAPPYPSLPWPPSLPRPHYRRWHPGSRVMPGRWRLRIPTRERRRSG